MTQTKESLNVPAKSGTIDTTAEVEAAPPNAAAQRNQQQQSSTNKLLQQQQQLSPLVYWAQTEKQITLKVDLRDSKGTVADFSNISLSFNANGYGARGTNEYKFDLRFFAAIDEEESHFRVYDNKIEFYIAKRMEAWWPRLVATPQKPHWLKIDFDRWRTEDDALLEQEEERPRNVMHDYEQEFDRLQKQELGYCRESAKRIYMFFYNLMQFVGFLYIICVLSVKYYRDGEASIPHAYENVGNAVKFLQLLQYLEVCHPIFGYTKGHWLVPFLQVTGRNFILFIMIDMEPRLHNKPVVFFLFTIWTLVEIFRYPYYITQLFNIDIGLLTWIRYTIWIPLYPLGIIGEGIIILRNIPYLQKSKRFDIDMPNSLNCTFDMIIFLYVYLLVLILPGGYYLMSHMSNARAKKLGYARRHHHFD